MLEQKWVIFGTFHRHCGAQFQPVPAAGRHCSASVPASGKPSAGTPVPSAGQTADLDHHAAQSAPPPRMTGQSDDAADGGGS